MSSWPKLPRRQQTASPGKVSPARVVPPTAAPPRGPPQPQAPPLPAQAPGASQAGARPTPRPWYSVWCLGTRDLSAPDGTSECRLAWTVLSCKVALILLLVGVLVFNILQTFALCNEEDGKREHIVAMVIAGLLVVNNMAMILNMCLEKPICIGVTVLLYIGLLGGHVYLTHKRSHMAYLDLAQTPASILNVVTIIFNFGYCFLLCYFG